MANRLPQIQPLTRLQATWWLFLVVESAVIVFCYWFLYGQTKTQQQISAPANQWLILAALVIGVELWLIRRNLRKNHRQGEVSLLPTLGIGNVLTILRGLAYALMAGFLFAPRPGGWLDWAPAILYSFACLADFFDGYLARITNHSTLLGEVLDMEFDGLGILISVALAVQYGQLPFVYLLIGVARPLFVLGLRLRKDRGLPEYPMTPSSNRRIVAGVHMGFMMFLLWPVFAPPATSIAAFLFGMPIVLSFLRDWLVVTGALDPASDGYQRVHRLSTGFLFGWLPPVLRIGAVILGMWIVRQAIADPGPWRILLVNLGIAGPILMAILIGVGGVAALAALFGIATRLAGIGLIAVAITDFLARTVILENGLLFAVAISLVLLGSGRFALWTPEEYIFRHRTGQRAQTHANSEPAS
ncbi:MAG: CDP-alcohol phosphatidyltransferase family protein [Caldilineaceae bacterium]|nr:CDP-alcohol phosphatidyltransferase family protein [Caldilineaceae bacterium]